MELVGKTRMRLLQKLKISNFWKIEKIIFENITFWFLMSSIKIPKEVVELEKKENF